ncbi:MAG: PH domain-containing protein [Proteobacteria bacterium]|nr:PH domain-containing protein [Pseudomonadota bacterium]
MNEFEHEPIPGLPARLPPGEELLWQGSPEWRAVARRVMHVRGVSCYFAAIIAWRIASGWYDGQAARQIAESTLWLLGLGLATLAFLLWVAHLIARGTVYSISTQRVVMRFGIALPIALNIPFRTVSAAGLKVYADGTGDIPLRLNGDGRVAYLHLWPHARPWMLNRAEPMLRGIPHAQAAASILSRALAA